MNPIIEELIRQRKELHLSQQEVARRMGTGQTTVARVENGERSPKLETIERFAKAVNCKLVVKKQNFWEEGDDTWYT